MGKIVIEFSNIDDPCPLAVLPGNIIRCAEIHFTRAGGLQVLDEAGNVVTGRETAAAQHQRDWDAEKVARQIAAWFEDARD